MIGPVNDESSTNARGEMRNQSPLHVVADILPLAYICVVAVM